LLSWLEHLELNSRPDEVVFELMHKRQLLSFIAHLLVLIVEEVEAFGQILDSDLIRAIEVIHTRDISLKGQVVVLLVVKPAEQIQSVHMFIRLVAGAAISRDDQLVSFQVNNFE
jgi:hypothetical protein